MPGFGIINRVKKIKISFGADPLYNIHGSICALAYNSDLEGLPEWVGRTMKSLTEEQISDLRRFGCAAHLIYLIDAPDFPSWVDALERLSPETIQKAVYEHGYDEFCYKVGSDSEMPALEDLVQSRDLYFETMRKMTDPDFWDEKQDMLENDWLNLSNPREYRDGMVKLYRWLWADYLEKEWTREIPVLQESVRAFESIDYSSLNIKEAFVRITDRDSIHTKFQDLFPRLKEIRFIPSPHMGPYLMKINVHDGVFRLLIRARVPGEAKVQPASSELSRSEILMRLSALSDDIRLRILELASERGEVTTQDAMDILGLSQSSASRHLNQLAATGFLSTRPQDRVKQYSLNLKRLRGTFSALENFLKKGAGQ